MIAAWPTQPSSAPTSRRASRAGAWCGAMRFRSSSWRAIWEAVARAGMFPARLFPSLETIAAAFWRLTLNGILPHHALDTVIRLGAGFALAAVGGRRARHPDGTLAPRRGHHPAAGQHRRADPRHRLCAAVPVVVRPRQQERGAAGRLRVGLPDHLQHLDRREGREGHLGALRAGDGRGRPDACSATSSCRAPCPTSSPACGSASRRPGASWSGSRCSPPCRGASAG